MPFTPEQKQRFEKAVSAIETVSLSDAARLQPLVEKLRNFRGDHPEKLLGPLEAHLERAEKRTPAPMAEALRYSFPEELPITAKVPEISDALKKNPVVIVCGSTGSGKTTQLPKLALAAGLGRRARIGCTQPRRIAASSLAGRVAAELGVAMGNEVGYKVRFDDSTSEKTVVKFMTDGILLAETREDPLLLQYDCIILDEVHERSLNIDFLLGYMKLLLKKRNNLKLIVSSATLESERISEFFDHAPVIEVEGRLFPIEDHYLEPFEDEETDSLVARGVTFLNDLDPRGDILVFLPGEREIRDCAELLRGRRFPNTEILPLFGRLSKGDQQKIFNPSRFRRIVLATNVAETSLTIPGIRYVVDSGLVRLSRYNPRTRIQELPVEAVSQASARQRRGRCGRLRDGICVHLYTEESLLQSAEFTPPEIQRSSLSGVILQMAELNLPPLGEFPLVDEPASALIREGMRTLNDLGAMNGNRITAAGHRMAHLPLDPHLGRMLLEGFRRKVLPEMLVIVAFLSIPDPRERPFEKAKEADEAHKKFSSGESDFLGILKLWKALEEESSHQGISRFAHKNYLNYRRLREWRNLVDDLRVSCAETGCEAEFKIDLETLSYDALHKVILSGLPRQMGMYLRETRQYSDMTGRKFLIFPGSGLAAKKNPPDALVSFALVETSRVFARCNAAVKPEWLEEIAPQLCAYVYDNEHWDPGTGFVSARERVTAGALVIHPGRRCHYAKTHPREAREIFIREALGTGEATLPGTWLEENAYLVRELMKFELKIRRPGSVFDDAALFDHYNAVLPPALNSVSAVKQEWNRTHRNYCPDPERITQEHARDLREEDYPDFVSAAGQRFPLSYRFDPGEDHDGVTLIVPEDALNLLNPYLPDYLVPGYLPEKIELLLRNLPKKIRQQLMPISDCVQSFMTAFRNGEIFTEQPLADALADFINPEYGLELDEEDLEGPDLPEYLIMKIAVLNQKKKVDRILREFPDVRKLDSCLSGNIPAAKKWTVSGSTAWPDLTERMPESVTVATESETAGYPGLAPEEKSIGRRLFLKESDARASHAEGLIRLTDLTVPLLGKHLIQAMKIPHPMELSFFIEYHSWKEDLKSNAIRKAFGTDSWNIRSAAEWERALERARDHAAGELAESMARLDRIYDLYSEVVVLHRKIQKGGVTYDSVKRHLSILFRPGFLRPEEAFEEYERYLKALRIRLQRAIASLSKDESKSMELEPYAKKIELALQTVPDLTKAPELYDFFLLLEEARINRYAPEIQTRRKCGAVLLEETWEHLKF